MKQTTTRSLAAVLVSLGLVAACGGETGSSSEPDVVEDELAALDEGLRDMQDMRPNVMECLDALELCVADSDLETCKMELAELCRPPHPPGQGAEGQGPDDRPQAERPDGPPLGAEGPRGPHSDGAPGERPEGPPPGADGPRGDRPQGDGPPPRGDRPQGEGPYGDVPQNHGMRHAPDLRPCFDGLFACIDGELDGCFDDARECVQAQLTAHFDDACEHGLERCADENAPAERCASLANRCAEGLPE